MSPTCDELHAAYRRHCQSGDEKNLCRSGAPLDRIAIELEDAQVRLDALTQLESASADLAARVLTRRDD
jgi:hypothetical protein